MALLTDDMDIHQTWLYMILGGNGDFYINTVNADEKGVKSVHTVRISTSGGLAPTEVKIAAAELFRALEKHKLNEYPD